MKVYHRKSSCFAVRQSDGCLVGWLRQRDHGNAYRWVCGVFDSDDYQLATCWRGLNPNRLGELRASLERIEELTPDQAEDICYKLERVPQGLDVRLDRFGRKVCANLGTPSSPSQMRFVHGRRWSPAEDFFQNGALCKPRVPWLKKVRSPHAQTTRAKQLAERNRFRLAAPAPTSSKPAPPRKPSAPRKRPATESANLPTLF